MREKGALQDDTGLRDAAAPRPLADKITPFQARVLQQERSTPSHGNPPKTLTWKAKEPRYGRMEAGAQSGDHVIKACHSEATLQQQQAKRQLLDTNPELLERRKALAMAAFVRNDTSELMHSMRQAAHLSKSLPSAMFPRAVTEIPRDLLQPSKSHVKQHVEVPGQLYTGGTPGRPMYPYTASTNNIYTHLAAMGSSTDPSGAALPGVIEGGSKLNGVLQTKLYAPAHAHLGTMYESIDFYNEISHPGTPLSPVRAGRSPRFMTAPGTPPWQAAQSSGLWQADRSNLSTADLLLHVTRSVGGATEDVSAAQMAFDRAVMAARAELECRSVPATPIAIREQRRVTGNGAAPAPADFAPAVPGTMNGIGHPLLNDPILLPPEATEPKFVLNHRIRHGSAEPGGCKTHLAPLTLGVGNIQITVHGARGNDSHAPAQPAARQTHLGSSVTASKLDPGDDPAGVREGRPKSIASPSKSGLPVVLDRPAAAEHGMASVVGGTGQMDNHRHINDAGQDRGGKPLSEDTLNLWKGKRLNITESKIEAKLHTLRHNPTAKMELQTRVSGFLTDKAQEMAELAALQLFASEKREQKAITFLERQSRYQPAHRDPVRIESMVKKPVFLTGVAALFDPRSGEPINDHHPLPANSTQYWAGFVHLSHVLHALKTCLDASNWAHLELGLQHKSAAKIQAGWRGHAARKHVSQLKSRRDHLLRTSRKMALGHTEQSAAHLILDFLRDFDAAGRRGAALAALHQAVAGVGHEKAKQEVVRATRLAILARQWSAVEAAAIEVARKRTRGNAILGITAPAPAAAKKQTQSMLTGALQARKKGTMTVMYAEDREAAIKAATEDALTRTFGNDRIILEDCSVIPQAVKGAILSVYLEHKFDAYVALVGLTWRARAQAKAGKRATDAKQAAKQVMSSSPPPPPEDEPSLLSLLSVPVADGGEEPGDFEGEAMSRSTVLASTSDNTLAAEGSTSELQGPAGTVTEDGSVGGAAASDKSQVPLPTRHSIPTAKKPLMRSVTTRLKDNPVLPHFRTLATPMEIKALMQQGVQEVPVFNTYLLKGQLNDYGSKLSNSIANSYNQADDKGKKALVKASKQLQGAASTVTRTAQSSSMGGGRPKSAAPPKALDTENHNSFTVALLMHRWKSECTPRAHACLRKRYGLLKIDLVDCMAMSKVYNNEEVGQHLQGMVAGA